MFEPKFEDLSKISLCNLKAFFIFQQKKTVAKKGENMKKFIEL